MANKKWFKLITAFFLSAWICAFSAMAKQPCEYAVPVYTVGGAYVDLLDLVSEGPVPAVVVEIPYAKSGMAPFRLWDGTVLGSVSRHSSFRVMNEEEALEFLRGERVEALAESSFRIGRRFYEFSVQHTNYNVVGFYPFGSFTTPSRRTNAHLDGQSNSVLVVALDGFENTLIPVVVSRDQKTYAQIFADRRRRKILIKLFTPQMRLNRKFQEFTYVLISQK